MAGRAKTFLISEPHDLEKVDSWWAGLLLSGAKEIVSVEWTANGNLSWNIQVNWKPIPDSELPFKVCMPAYASFTADDLQELLEDVQNEYFTIQQHLKLFSGKIKDWDIMELESVDLPDELDEHMMDFDIDPSLSYGSKLDTVEKIMVSEFLWPSYKSLKKALLLCETRIAEISKELELRSDSSYTVVHVDRGMLRKAFRKQLGYDNRWLFATEEELTEDENNDDDS